MKRIKNVFFYLMCLILGVIISLLANKVFYSNKSSVVTQNEETNNTINSGYRYTICKNENIESNEEKLIMNNNTLEFYLNIYNYYNYNKEENILRIFINNTQVNFSVDDKNVDNKFLFNLEPKNNLFKIVINDCNNVKDINDILLIISEKESQYDITNDFDARKNNKVHFVNTMFYNYNTLDNKEENYEDYIEESNKIKLKDGVYINKTINKGKIR